MGSIKEYFSEAAKGLKSLVDGMMVTGKEFVTPKITEQYPENRATLQIADRFRAELTLIYDQEGRHKCIGCGICQMNCPNGTIQLTTKMVDLPDGKKKRKLDKYMYDLGSCTFCMLCVTTCPQDALEFSNDFEQATFTRNSLMKQLNYRPEPKDEPAAAPKPAVDPEKLAKIKAEALAKAAKIKAEREAAAAAQGGKPTGETKQETSKAEEPKSETPKVEDPKAEAPKAEEPKAEAPKAEEPKAEAPKAEEP
ncbi:MAG: 4Fe-4S binding protein, partial [Muribaculaceae bacterium]|nr:4Fe-4S binding protein [Muribaculaceae bacterium]